MIFAFLFFLLFGSSNEQVLTMGIIDFYELRITIEREARAARFVPWGPLGRAFLTDRFNEYSRFAEADRRASVAQFRPEALTANMALLSVVREWAARKNVTPSQFSLGWLLAQKPWMSLSRARPILIILMRTLGRR